MTMPKLLTTLLVWLLATPVAAQDGPIARAVKQYGPPTTTTYSTRMRSPVMFWSGVGLVAGGAIVSIAAVTWAQDSDLSLEDRNTRLGRDLAPCGTEPSVTRLPIADCKSNTGLLLLGSGLAVGGGLLMIIGGQTVQITQIGPRAFAARIRF
jgi:hypothetical protein